MPITAKNFLAASQLSLDVYVNNWHAAKTCFLEDAKLPNKPKNATFFV
jgi:hypothetical protein